MVLFAKRKCINEFQTLKLYIAILKKYACRLIDGFKSNQLSLCLLNINTKYGNGFKEVM